MGREGRGREKEGEGRPPNVRDTTPLLVILSVIVCLNCCSILTSSRVLWYCCVLSTAFYRINE